MRAGLFLLVAATAIAHGQDAGPRRTKPDAIVDLADATSLRIVDGRWSTAEARIVPATNPRPGPDLRPTGEPGPAFALEPGRQGDTLAGTDFVAIAPGELLARRGAGKLSFQWYRLEFRLPERLGDTAVTGGELRLEIVADDISEIWVDGAPGPALGDVGGPAALGFNAANSVVLSSDARPLQEFRVAILVANGPLGRLPANHIWVRSAALELRNGARKPRPVPVPVTVERLDPALDAVIEAAPVAERLAGGFGFTEGPLLGPDGSLLFSDPDNNTLYRWREDLGVTIHLPRSGYAGIDTGRYRQPGSNGLARDREGRLIVCEHGRRRVVRYEPTGAITVLADRFEGRRLNSPNDVVVTSDGAVWFTDPVFGLPGFEEDPARELDFAGVYRWKAGGLELMARDLRGPNGIAVAPDERTLYVANWDLDRKVVQAYAIGDDGRLGPPRVLFDATSLPGEEALDGVDVDPEGRLFVSGPGGLHVLAPGGKRLGVILLPELPANTAISPDGRTLFLAARSSIYRLRLRGH
jgi:gluconolactonase